MACDLCDEYKKEILKIKTELSLVKLKLSLAEYALNKHNDSINSFFNLEEDGFHIRNVPDENVTIFIHEHLASCPKKITVHRKKKKSLTPEEIEAKNTEKGIEKKKTKNFRTVKSILKLTDEKPREQEEKIRKVEEEIADLIPNISVKDITDNINSLLEQLQNARVVKKQLQEICSLRGRLLGKLNIKDYTKLVDTHIVRIQTLLSQKTKDYKKIKESLNIALSPLDQRLSFYEGYYNTMITHDDVEKLSACLEANITYAAPTRFIPFSYEENVTKLCNYSLSVFNLKSCMKRVIYNPYGFSNVVYLPLESSTPEDPYSFYILNKLENGKRFWKMEVRLDNFCTVFENNLRSYCISLFRKIYKDVFGDNIYRENYQEKAIIFEKDCEQLLENIFLTCKHKQFCNEIRELVVNFSTLNPTDLDKFDFTADDRINKRQFNQISSESERDNAFLCMAQIFDQISRENSEKIIYRFIQG